MLPPGRDTGAGIVLTEDAARLVGPGGELPPDVHRPLLALATHPRIAAPGVRPRSSSATARLPLGALQRRK